MAKSKARTDLQRAVDDILTGRINNQVEARMFILKTIARLSKNIQSRFGDINDLDSQLVQVYIKGNSALNLYKMNVTDDKKKKELFDKKWSDFDNQIVINPFLPKVWWYEILNQIHDCIKNDILPPARDGFLIGETDKGKLPKPSYDGSKTLKQIDISDTELKDELKDDFNKYPGIAKGLPLEHQLKMQSNVLLCLSSEYLHPVNYFDNIRTLFAKKDKDIDFMKPEYSEANEYFPPGVAVLKDFRGKKVKKDSSIWINTTIGKFLLYRLIARYKKPGLSYEGQVNREDINAEAIKFRGEIIDISIPRRESEETLNQWVRFSKNIQGLTDNNPYFVPDNKVVKRGVQLVRIQANPRYLGDDGQHIRIPDFEYQLEENINMINEVLTDTSGSPHKFYKRLTRGYAALTAIEQISQDDDQHPLNNSKVFKEALDLDTLYNKSTQSGIKCFFKQFSRTLRFDYFTPLLDDTISLALKQVLPKAGIADLEFADYNDWYDDFEVKAGGDIEEKINAKGVITAKFESDEEQKQMKQLLICTQVGHKINEVLATKFKLPFAKLEIINALRVSLEKPKPDNQKVFFDGILSTKLDKYLRLGRAYDESYPLPVVPLYLLTKKAYSAEELQEEAPKDWTVTKATSGQKQDYGYDFLLKHKDLDHIVVLKLLAAGDNAKWQNIEQKLEELLVWQHASHQLLLARADNSINSLYTLITQLKKLFEIKIENNQRMLDYFDEVGGFAALYPVVKKNLPKAKDNAGQIELIFGALTEAKELFHELSQRSNLLYCNNKFQEFTLMIELLALLTDKLEDMTKTYKDKATQHIHAALLKLQASMQPANYQQEGNLYQPLAEYLINSKKLLAMDQDIDPKDFSDYVKAIITEVKTQLAGYAKYKKDNVHASIFAAEKSSRLLVDDNGKLYRVLLEKGIADYIDYRIATARDFYLIHWLDKSRIHYKMNAVSFTTNLTQKAIDAAGGGK
ncbi:hypothetical protein [Thalassomonas sp. RHCl1]|uniref:hypothetical protein n=1 Tax=Thalassomonas sp. RHCl1 TaxID=2995320 RepID=UPI00248AEA96|nr:hypothetical protein [Thalassomonas sp. RHCl1]